ncbi:MAG TPA: YCF48-related protein, partial [Fibrobacteria bacterium]|nr:YCF48-related protein [Fibrobacteria bacterium]
MLQEDTWYEDKARKGANLHDIVREHKARAAAKQSALKDDLTALLQKDPELYELEKDHRFKRWLEYVEPRVSPSGDLSQLDRGQEEIAALVPLDGEARPAAYGTWEPIGPYSEGTTGAGRLNWVEFHPQDTSAMMVGSPSGGVWFTRDGGKTWTTPTDKIAVLGAAWAAYHPTRPDTIYLGTGDGYHGDTKSIGVLRSTDGGKTWGRTGLEFPITGSTQIVKLVTDPRNPDKLFVAASNGVYVSLDGGATFTKSTGITGKVWDLEIHPGNPDIVYASTAAFHRSTDGGKTFSAVAGATSTYRMLIGVTPAEPSWVYLLRGSRSATEGVELSIDDGLTFARKGTGAEIGCSQAWYDYALAVNPDKADDLAAGCLRVFRSGDGGTAWTQAGASYHVDIQGLAFRRDGALFAVTDGGIYRATGRSTWQSLNNNLNIGQSYRLGVDRHDYDRVCTGRQDNGTDFRDGGEFRRALGGDGFECFWNN